LSVEHLLATCYGLGIDNLEVKVTGPEVPFGDGSALPFVRILQAAGIKTSRKTRRVQSLHGPVIAHAGDAFVCALPLPGAGRAAALNLNYLIRFPEPVAGEQFYQSWLTPTEFVSELSPARTFGYRQSVPTWLRPLARPGGNLILPAHPRMTGEQVRHKVLDLIGDLALLGRRLRAAVFAYKSGHRLNQQLVKQLEEQWT
jgi:UDP-3-O-[3-hydroxymyristoyl] N-acetylglucosamine deacetylase